MFNYLGPFEPCTLALGDSIFLQNFWAYPLNQPITKVNFIILTDKRLIKQNDASFHKCGAFPVEEYRYDNNESFIIINTDSIMNKMDQ